MTEDLPGTADEDAERATWHRRFAGMANNRGWTLAEQSVLGDADRRELLYAAHADAHHWDAVGTGVHAARAFAFITGAGGG